MIRSREHRRLRQHIVNTASIFGVFAGALGPYGISKHAVVALSETLHFQLFSLGARVGVSVLCPGAVRTRFGTSARNRPAATRSAAAGRRSSLGTLLPPPFP